jgi:hypothetical protein
MTIIARSPYKTITVTYENTTEYFTCSCDEHELSCPIHGECSCTPDLPDGRSSNELCGVCRFENALAAEQIPF